MKFDKYDSSCAVDAAHGVLRDLIVEYASNHTVMWHDIVQGILSNEPDIQHRTLMALAVLLIERRLK